MTGDARLDQLAEAMTNLSRSLDDKDATIAKLTAQRDALLAACRAGHSDTNDGPDFTNWLGNQVQMRGFQQAAELAWKKARLEREAIAMCDVKKESNG